MVKKTKDIISPETAKTLHGLFLERVRRTPEGPAYQYYNNESNEWKYSTWSEMAFQVERWQTAMKREPLKRGDRVAIWVSNSREWIMMDQAALGLGLVVVPLYHQDRPENIAYILNHAGVKLLLVEDERNLEKLNALPDKPEYLVRVLSLNQPVKNFSDKRLCFINEWLPERGDSSAPADSSPDDLATIVYTSGTTGPQKGVMLSHRNILWNAYSGMQSEPVFREDVFLSFLPLSHALERTVGYYLPVMAGASVAYARSIPKLSEDLVSVRPTVLVSVPRIFERVYMKIKSGLQEKNLIAGNLFKLAVNVGWSYFEYMQKRIKWNPAFLILPLLDRLVSGKIRKRLGGRLRLSVVGGASLPAEVAEVFIGLGVQLLHGYGMTETSPVISVNQLKDNLPASVGIPLLDVRTRTGKKDELLIKSPGVMLGYWNNPEATAAIIDSDGWLHTGDKSEIKEGRIYITGRIKEIIVMANGEKVPPANIESSIEMDPLIDQAIVIGEGKPYLAALVVINKEVEELLAKKLNLDPDNPAFLKSRNLLNYILQRISSRMSAFPGYAIIRRIVLLHEPWTIENGLMTPTLKLRRQFILHQFNEEVAALYKGHGI
ncbi:MAG: long-chain fatty acid--CoA ligase [Nitrospirota bacterium]